jgi:hypothetical protein
MAIRKVHREDMTRNNHGRIPPGQPRLKLTATGLKRNERGYWAKPEQFEELIQGGYQFVSKDAITVGTDKDGNTDLGSLVSQSAGSDGTRLYLLKIRKDWYAENQKIKQDEITARETQMINPPESQTQYLPNGQNQITHSTY